MSKAKSYRSVHQLAKTGATRASGMTTTTRSFRGSRCASPIAATRASCSSPGIPRTRRIRRGELSARSARSRSSKRGQKARSWLELIAKGIDPKMRRKHGERAEAQRRQVNTFAAVAAEFLERHASRPRKRAPRRSGSSKANSSNAGAHGRSPTSCRKRSPLRFAPIVKRGAPYQAHNALGYIRRLFNWAIGTHEFGIAHRPSRNSNRRI